MQPELIAALERILDPFVDECLPGGGIDLEKSRWQASGRGAGVGSDMFPGRADVRYLPFAVMGMYWLAEVTGRSRYRAVADAQARFVALGVHERTPTWALGNALEMIGVYHRHNPRSEDLIRAVRRIVDWARARKVRITTADGVSFGHFPCGYGQGAAKDTGWTNDLSMFGSGLVWAHELTGDPEILDDAVSFVEYFLQPWRPGALGDDGYWHCGTWREDWGTWVIGPLHYTGFESTDRYSDEASWVFSTLTCTDFLIRLRRVKPDPRLVDRCHRAAEWTFENCQFEDGAVGVCGRDDKWLGTTAHAVRQVAMLAPWLGDRPDLTNRLRTRARSASVCLCDRLIDAPLDGCGVEWVNRTTSTDPLVNVATLWAAAVLGVRDGLELFG